MGSFQELKVWQKAVDVAVLAYRVSQQYPESEKFGLRSQLCRAVISISSNIAEGHGRRSESDFARFVKIELGSCRECQSLLIVSERLGLLGEERELSDQLEEIAKMLSSLAKTLTAAK